jgi:hypothetical protein
MTNQETFEATKQAIIDMIWDRVTVDVIEDIEEMTYEEMASTSTPPRTRPKKRPFSE